MTAEQLTVKLGDAFTTEAAGTGPDRARPLDGAALAADLEAP